MIMNCWAGFPRNWCGNTSKGRRYGLDSRSVPKFGISVNDATVALTWNFSAGQSYGIDSTLNLEAWTEVDDGVPASIDGFTTTYEISDVEPGVRYYRVRRE